MPVVDDVVPSSITRDRNQVRLQLLLWAPDRAFGQLHQAAVRFGYWRSPDYLWPKCLSRTLNPAPRAPRLYGDRHQARKQKKRGRIPFLAPDSRELNRNLTTNTQVAEAHFFHLSLVKEITTVNQHRSMHETSHFGVVQRFELLPIRDQYESVTTIG